MTTANDIMVSRIIRLAVAAAPFVEAKWCEEIARTLAGWDESDVTADAVREAMWRRWRHLGMGVRNDDATGLCGALVAAWHGGER